MEFSATQEQQHRRTEIVRFAQTDGHSTQHYRPLLGPLIF